MSADSRWFKLNVNWMDSDWLIVLSAGARLAWVQLIAYTKSSGFGGKVKAKSSLVFARQNFLGEEDVEQMIRAAKLAGALAEDDGLWILSGWAKHQGDDTNAERQKRHRERQHTCDSNGNNALRNARREENISPPVSPSRGSTKGFVKPTESEVASYMAERSVVDVPSREAARFVAYHDSKGWVIGRSPMKDWKAAVRTWELNFKRDGGHLRPVNRSGARVMSADELAGANL